MARVAPSTSPWRSVSSPVPSDFLCFSSGWNGTLPLIISQTPPSFHCWCFSSLPHVQRAQQWTLILDWAALPSASRCCWESMARLQDPCAHTGEKWTARERGGGERVRERDIVLELSCLCGVFLSFSHSLTSTTEEQERWEPARRTCEWRSLSHVGSSTKTQASLDLPPSRRSQE